MWTRVGVVARGWMALGCVLVVCLGMAAPGFAQQAEKGPTPRRGDTGGPMQLVVDTVVKRTLTDPDFKRLAETSPGPKWKNKDREEMPSVALWTLLKEGGVSRDAVKKVQIHSRSKLLASFEGSDLGKIDQLVLRTGETPDRPWRLGSVDPKDSNPYGRAVVRKIEVTTAAAAK